MGNLALEFLQQYMEEQHAEYEKIRRRKLDKFYDQ